MSDSTNPERKSRTLVLCFDGTSNEYDADNTNVVKLFALLKKDDFDEQLCYYQAGVGTWYEPGVVSPLLRVGAKILDLAFATFLDSHVLDGYKFLMQNYRVGDKICIFGFSRGAYTARAVGGFLHKVGLLPRDNHSQVPFAYKMYQREDDAGLRLCAGFKQTYCRDVKIDFMGVWDTVASVGVISGRTLPFTNSNRNIKVFRHALSLDEHRAKFRPNNYHRIPRSKEAGRPDADLDVEVGGPPRLSIAKDSRANSPEPQTPTSSVSSAESGEKAKDKKTFFPIFKKKKRTATTITATGKAFAPELVETGVYDDVREVWFSGCHSDVGGGAVSNETTESLSNISLRWMVREAMQADCGIKFDLPALVRAKLDLDPEPSQSELELDALDAIEPIHDEIKKHRMWWILELVPLHYSWQDADGVWHKDWSSHMGRGRKIEDASPKFHVTVKRRMEALGYVPKAKWKKDAEVYVR